MPKATNRPPQTPPVILEFAEENPVFTRHPHGMIAALNYIAAGLTAKESALALKAWMYENSVAVHVNQVDSTTLPGHLLLGLYDEEQLQTLLQAKVIVYQSRVIHIQQPIYVKGTPLTIESYLFYPEEERTEGVRQLFAEYGEIVQISTYKYGAGSVMRSSDFQFILDIPLHSPREIIIPRVAHILDCNIIFWWPGAEQFCSRCGGANHAVAKCYLGPSCPSWDFALGLPMWRLARCRLSTYTLSCSSIPSI